MISELMCSQTNMELSILATFLVSLILTGIIIPQILLIAYRKNLFDEPDERKIHKGTIPRLGGIAFVPSIVFAVAFTIGISHSTSLVLPEIMPDTARTLSFGTCGLLLLYLVGIADDLVGIRYRAKFVVQIIVGIFLICGGLYINNLHGFCGIYHWSPMAACALTVLVTVFFVNAINLIDGIDGLASGLSAVALAFYGIVFAYCGDIYNALISFAAFGTLVQFFYYNVFGNPVMGKKIFMGDTGALCIGFIITYLSISMSRVNTFSFAQVNPIVVAFSPMLVPCFDVLRVFFHRIRNGQSPFLPDRCHIHHKLLALGMKTPQAMCIILATSVFFVVGNIALSPFLNSALLLAIDLIVWTVANILLTKQIERKKAQTAAQKQD